MKTLSLVLFVLAAFLSGCSSKATVENRKPPVSEDQPRQQEKQSQESREPRAQFSPEQPSETQPSTGKPQNSATSEKEVADAGTNEEVVTEEEVVAEEEVTTEEDAGPAAERDAGVQAQSEPETEPEPEPEPSDPHVFATEELGVLVRVDSSTIVQPAERPFWADDALATSAFERENGKIYTVLVYEKREDELFEDWLARSKVGATRVSQRTVYARYGKIGYVYKADDYGAVPNVHIVVPSDRFVYYFRSQEETFDIPDDFIDFIRHVEVQ